MSKPVTKYEPGIQDWDAPPSSDGDICNVGFECAKKLSEMTEEEKDELYRKHVEHCKTVVSKDVVELTPTQVFEEPPKKKKRQKAKNAEMTMGGTVVPGEDFDLLVSLVGEQEAERLAGPRPRPVDDGEVERKEMASKTAAERNALARFRSI